MMTVIESNRDGPDAVLASANLAQFDLDGLRIEPQLPAKKGLFAGFWTRLTGELWNRRAQLRPVQAYPRLGGEPVRESLGDGDLLPPANDGAPRGNPRGRSGFRLSRFG